jgi:pimeloyl-ACP methyl ester carboxylesterase
MSDERDVWFSTRDPRIGDPPPNWGTAVWLRLQRYADIPGDAGGPGPPVLLLHGGSANHRTFTVPGLGLASWLLEAGFDPWLLDWRGSSVVTDKDLNDHTLKHESDLYTFNRAALEDLPAAIGMMRWRGVHQPIAAIGHCMGAAVIAEAVALGHTREIDRIVLLSLGLFYEAPIDSRLKSEERILERLSQDVADVPCIDPRLKDDGTLRHPWPADLDRLYDAWPPALRAHARNAALIDAVNNLDDPWPEELRQQARDAELGEAVLLCEALPQTLRVPVRNALLIDEMCNRLTFMYGMPYRHENLPEVFHRGAGDVALPSHFGGFPLKMYLHAARNLRRGHAIFSEGIQEPTDQAPGSSDIVSDAARERFRELSRVTLITGGLNRLWHRDSIDRMHEWSCRGSSRSLSKIRKHVLANFAHQDLLWNERSPNEVYPLIAEGLGVSRSWKGPRLASTS